MVTSSDSVECAMRMGQYTYKNLKALSIHPTELCHFKVNASEKSQVSCNTLYRRNSFKNDEVANRHNSRSRVIASSHAEFPPVLESKHPTSVMAFGAVAGDERVMPPHLLPAGLRIGTTEYLATTRRMWCSYKTPSQLTQQSRRKIF